MNRSWILAFIISDAVVVTLVGLFLIRKRLLAGAGIDFDRLKEFSETTEQRVEDHLRSRWNGDVATLPAVLETLVTSVEGDANAHGLPVQRAWIKQAVARWIQTKKLVGARELNEAMRQLA